MELPRTVERTDDVIASMDDDPRDMADFRDVFQDPVIAGEEAIIHEVVALYPSYRICMVGGCKGGENLRVESEFECCTFPSRPSYRGFFTDFRIRRGQTLEVGRDHIAALFFRNRFEVIFPSIGEDEMGTRLIKPLELLRSA